MPAALRPRLHAQTPPPPAPAVTADEIARRRQAVALAPQDMTAILALAQAYADSRRLADLADLLDAKRKELIAPNDRKQLTQGLAGVQSLWGRMLSPSDPAGAATHARLALGLYRDLKDRTGEVVALRDLGSACDRLSRYDQAADCFRQALIRDRAAQNRDGVARALLGLGLAQFHLSRCAQALDCCQQALPLFQQIGDRSGEADALNNRGAVQAALGRPDQAADDYQQALALYRQLKDPDGESGALSNLGVTWHRLGQYEKAVGCFNQALTLFRQGGDRDGEAKALNNLGTAQVALGRYDDALVGFQQSLPLYRAVGDRNGLAVALNNIGTARFGLQQYAQAADAHRQALTLFRQVKDRNGEGTALGGLGLTAYCRKQYALAEACFRQEMRLCREIGNRAGEAKALGGLGLVHDDRKQFAQAADCYGQALALNREVKDPSGEATTLSNLMGACRSLGRLRLAVFYGKQAVNAFQAIRRDIGGLDRDTQASFLRSKESAYRDLADLLISQGRLPEAEQVLTMLKRQELSEVLRGSVSLPGIPGQLDLTPDEAAQEQRYAQIADQVTALGGQQQEMLDRKQAGGTLPAADQQRLEDVSAKLVAANHHLRLFLTRLATAFPAASADGPALSERLKAVKDAAGLQDTLRRLHDQGRNLVVLETVVAPDRYAVIVTTARSRKVAQYAIKDTDLNNKVAALQDALRDPHADPTGPARALYDVVFAPVEADLAQAHATTLLWSLDGSLRYIPIAALYDGTHYLVERFDNAVFTLGSQTGFGPDEGARWDALGLGVTQEHAVDDPSGGQPIRFPALPGVPAELHGVVRDDGHPDGALPGALLLDTQFTQAGMTDALQSGRHNVVHVASHFAMLPATPDRSFLLLGDGHPLTLSAMADDTTLFSGVDLLVLSACETAVGARSGDGREVDGLGSVAQQDGAKSVLASLWPVSDASTQQLMEAFYRGHEAHPGASKAGALRQAQLSLLHGAVAPPLTTAPDRGTAPSNAPRGGGQDPAFTPDPKAPYAHPFYWAPFVLIGNWR